VSCARLEGAPAYMKAGCCNVVGPGPSVARDEAAAPGGSVRKGLLWRAERGGVKVTGDLAPVGAEAHLGQILAALRFAEDEKVFVHDEIEAVSARAAPPTPRVFCVVLRFDDLLFKHEAIF